MERCVGEGSVEDLHAPPRSSGISSMHVSILHLVLIRAPQRLPPPRWLSWGLERRGPSDRSCAFERERERLQEWDRVGTKHGGWTDVGSQPTKHPTCIRAYVACIRANHTPRKSEAKRDDADHPADPANDAQRTRGDVREALGAWNGCTCHPPRGVLQRTCTRREKKKTRGARRGRGRWMELRRTCEERRDRSARQEC